ncbi:hypothetical protein JX266_002866 [Neoarthrinium moseri]|nr:hypothetical protein JX266_002866 [Neoarthrinium moseri]
MSKSQILLRDGIILVHDADSHVVPTEADLLIENSVIAKIEKAITPGPGAQVIDCKGKIISPGFIDTHRHLWQTQYKGAHANQTLMEYMVKGNFTGAFWSPEDLFWGQLSGALESIEAGTTTLVDHSSCNLTAEHSQAALQALLSTGLRAIYCFTPPRRLKSRSPFTVEDDASEETIARYQTLARGGPYGNGTVHIGYANDNIYTPAEDIKQFYATLRDPAKGRAKLITTHTIGGAMQGKKTPTAIEILHSHGLLGPDILLSHGNRPHEGDGALYQSTGASVSSTPNTELQMGGFPVCLRDDHYDNASLGVDCHSWGVTGIPGQMRLALQSGRAYEGQKLNEEGFWSRKPGGISAEQVFNLATLGGAKACGMQDEIGRVKQGMKADLVVFDGESPGMLAAAVEDPVAAIVLHSNPGDIDMVIIDGVVKKGGGKLLDVEVVPAPDASMSVLKPNTRLQWKDIVKKVLESRKQVMEKTADIDFEVGEQKAIDMLYLDRGALVET